MKVEINLTDLQQLSFAAEQLSHMIDLIKQNGKDWFDERDIPILQIAISAITSIRLTKEYEKLKFEWEQEKNNDL